MKTIHARNGHGTYETILETETNSIVSDEPISNGGNARGFSPQELLAASLGSCTSITLRMYANRKQWILDDVRVKVELMNDDKHNILWMKTEIEVLGNLTSEQKERLLQIANLCPIHKALTKTVSIKTELR